MFPATSPPLLTHTNTRTYTHAHTGELVVDQLVSRYGPRRSAWPKKLLRNLEGRNASLTAAVIERVGFVPKELFWPIGLTGKELMTSTEGECSFWSERVGGEMSGRVRGEMSGRVRGMRGEEG